MGRAHGATVAVVLALAGAGCGDVADEPLTKSEYVEQGDAICKKAGDELSRATREAFGDVDGEPSEEQLTDFVEDSLKPSLQGQVDDLRDLEPPEDDAEEINAIYEKVEGGLRRIEDDPTLILDEDDDPLAPATAAARRYGFRECSR